jgi:alginate O-acetyltransferase complex protein AlgI
MLFPTADYALFFLAAFAVAWALRAHLRAHKLFLLFASYAFYAHWDWRFLPLLIGISLLAFAVGRMLQLLDLRYQRRIALAAGVALSLSTLAVFKYLGFALSTLFGLLEAAGISLSPGGVPQLALPVGISFFVFHAISLMVDSYRGKIPDRIHALDALLYVAFFPQLVAGPILRASTFLPQLARAPDPRDIEASRAIELIVAGLAKKVLIANFLAARLVDPTFDAPASHGGLEALIAIYAYAAQIYCDFSGYSDIAIGSALLLGYRFPDNFDAPYRATSPQDFWRRWHISLSSWLRDYLFIPLGGSRRGPARTLLNLGVTMVLGGLWHGAAWSFVLWGALHGAGLAVHRLWSGAKSSTLEAVRASRAWPWAARLLTFHFVCLGWVFFRASSLESAFALLRALARPWTTGPWLSAALGLALVVGLFGQALPLAARERIRARFSTLPMVAQGAAFAAAVLFIEVLGPSGVAPFIYFQF